MGLDLVDYLANFSVLSLFWLGEMGIAWSEVCFSLKKGTKGGEETIKL